MVFHDRLRREPGQPNPAWLSPGTCLSIVAAATHLDVSGLSMSHAFVTRLHFTQLPGMLVSFWSWLVHFFHVWEMHCLGLPFSTRSVLARGWLVATPFPGDVSSPGLSLSQFSCPDPMGICMWPFCFKGSASQVLLKQQFLRFSLVCRLRGVSFIQHTFGNYVSENGICQDARKGAGLLPADFSYGE